MSIDDKTGADMLRTFMKQPVSTINLAMIIIAVAGWYYTREHNMERLSSAARAQEMRLERVEKKIEAGDVNDMVQNGKISGEIGRLDNRLSTMETDIKWLVRALGGPKPEERR